MAFPAHFHVQFCLAGHFACVMIIAFWKCDMYPVWHFYPPLPLCGGQTAPSMFLWARPGARNCFYMAHKVCPEENIFFQDFFFWDNFFWKIIFGGLISLIGGLISLIGGLISLIGGLISLIGGLISLIRCLISLVSRIIFRNTNTATPTNPMLDWSGDYGMR